MLVHDIAMKHGEVTHADGVGTLSAPPRVDRHEPDIVARDKTSGRLIIGEAKQGDDLFTDHSQEQLHDFSRHVEESGEQAVMVLGVPTGWRGEAERAVLEAGGLLDWTEIIEVGVPNPPALPDGS